MSHNWHEPKPGTYVGTLDDGRTVIEKRQPSESFRQGEVISTEFLAAGAKLPAWAKYKAPTPVVVAKPKAAPKKATPKRKVKAPAKPKARKR